MNFEKLSVGLQPQRRWCTCLSWIPEHGCTMSSRCRHWSVRALRSVPGVYAVRAVIEQSFYISFSSATQSEFHRSAAGRRKSGSRAFGRVRDAVGSAHELVAARVQRRGGLLHLAPARVHLLERAPRPVDLVQRRGAERLRAAQQPPPASSSACDELQQKVEDAIPDFCAKGRTA